MWIENDALCNTAAPLLVTTLNPFRKLSTLVAGKKRPLHPISSTSSISSISYISYISYTYHKRGAVQAWWSLRSFPAAASNVAAAIQIGDPEIRCRSMISTQNGSFQVRTRTLSLLPQKFLSNSTRDIRAPITEGTYEQKFRNVNRCWVSGMYVMEHVVDLWYFDVEMCSVVLSLSVEKAETHMV